MAKQRIRVGWVGGMTRNGTQLETRAAELGYDVEFHDGNVTGHRSASLRNLVHRSDVVVIVTELNSHRGMLTAREEARQAGRPVVILRKAGLHRFEETLASLASAHAA